MLKAVIFDMDGVIIDSEPQHARASKNVLKKYGVDASDEYCMSFIGSSTMTMAKDCIERFSLSVSADKLYEEFNHEKKVISSTEGYIVVPGVIDVIKELNKNGILLAIASSSSEREISDTVKSLGIHKYFSKLISANDVENPKPAPDIFNLAVRKLGLNKKDVIIIEDSYNGCTSASQAGIAVVGFENPSSGSQKLSQADVILTSFVGIETSFFEHVLSRFNNEPVTIANTKRLIIREIGVDDIKDLYKIYTDPKVKQYIDGIEDYLDEEIAKQKAYIKNVYSFYGYGLWGIYSKTTHGLIGRCGIENHIIDGKDEIMLSYLLDSAHWGYGYALECCHAVLNYARNTINVERIVAVIDKTNTRSINTAQKLGMKPEKTLIYNDRDSIMYVTQV